MTSQSRKQLTPSKYYGSPCPQGHGAEEGQTLRWKLNRSCVECVALKAKAKRAARQQGRACIVCGETGLPNQERVGAQYRVHPECRAERRRQVQKAAYRADPLVYRWRTRALSMGITVERLREMYEAADYSCQVCGIREDELEDKYATLAIDHDHRCCPGKRDGRTHRRACGKCVRGLLCPRCNKLLTLADQVTFAAIQSYMEA